MARTRQQTNAASVSKQEQTTTSVKPVNQSKKKSAVSKEAEDDDESVKTHAAGNTQIDPQQQDGSDAFKFTVPHNSTTMSCDVRPASPQANFSVMVYTHGAGGTISTPSVANFAQGFALASTDTSEAEVFSIVCFEGPMNLKSRTSMFRTVMEHCKSAKPSFESNGNVKVLGGTSMGARAAVMAASDSASVDKLVLSSYPLVGGNGSVRDEILLEIDETIEVLFVSGDKDKMCDLEQLNGVRAKMKAKSWLLTVEGATHGIDCRQKKRTKEVQMATGRIAYEWVAGADVKSTEAGVGGVEGCEMKMSLPLNNNQKPQQKISSPSVEASRSKKRGHANASKKKDEAPAGTTKKRQRVK